MTAATNSLTATPTSLVKIVDDELTKLGFVKKGMTWQRSKNELIQVVQLQKSRLAPAYHVNLGLCRSGNFQGRHVRYDDLEVFARLDQFVPSEVLDANAHTNGFQDAIFDSEEVELVRKAIRFGADSFFDLASSLGSLKKARANGKLRRAIFRASIIQCLQ